jgi:hypothetical protein
MTTVTSKEDTVVEGKLLIKDQDSSTAFSISYDSIEATLNIKYEEIV